MTPLAVIAFWSLELVVVAALAATPRGAVLGLAIALGALALPTVLSYPTLALALVALAVLWTAIRAADFVFDPAPTGFAHRLLHLFAVLDTRRLSRAAPRFDRRALLTLVAAFLCALAAVKLVVAVADLPPWSHWLSRWAGGALLTLAAFECLVATLKLLAAGFGWNTPLLHDAPHLSRTIAEFWGRRWNRMVSEVLEARAFAPFARRRPFLGLCAAFALSALIHAYLIGMALGATAALWWAAFFLVQPPLIALERRLGVRRWATWAGHAWTLVVLGSLSPLMTEPGLRAIGL